MPKKGKKGKKKKGADKEKKVKKSRHMNEKDTLTFEQEILDNNRQIARLRTRNQELETEVEIARAKLQQLEEDRSDVIAHLKRNLQYKNEEAQELNERLYALEELRKEEITKFRQKEEELEENYRTMENNLSTEIQLAAGKLSALEEWRGARNDLMKKFEDQEKRIDEQEKKHKEQLYEVEKSLIISKTKLQKEMEERLNELAQNFRDTTNLRIADTTKRAIRENIAMNKELDIMYQVCRDVNAKMCEYERRDHELKIQASLCETQTKMALNKMIKQNNILKKLAEEHVAMTRMQSTLKNLQHIAEENERLAAEYEEKHRKSQKKIQVLEKYIDGTRRQNKQILSDIEENKRDFDKLKEVVKRAKGCLKQFLKLRKSVETCGVCETKPLEEKEKFLRTMLDILGSDLKLTTNLKEEQADDVENYVQGCLGFVCPHYPLAPDPNQDITKMEKGEKEDEEDICEVNCCTFLEEGNEELKTSDYFPLDSDSSDVGSLFEEVEKVEEEIEK